jgi:hypothetical protein
MEEQRKRVEEERKRQEELELKKTVKSEVCCIFHLVYFK